MRKFGDDAGAILRPKRLVLTLLVIGILGWSASCLFRMFRIYETSSTGTVEPKKAAIPQLEFSTYPARMPEQEHFAVRLNFDKPSMSHFRRYQSYLKFSVANGKANVAGHYKLIDIPCGTGCHFWWLADLRSGEIFKTPTEEPVRFEQAIISTSSRLFLFKGTVMPNGDQCLFSYYEWLPSDRAFKPVLEGIAKGSC